MEKSDEVLEKINNGSILKELIDYSELSNHLSTEANTGNKLEVANKIKDSNKRQNLPNMKNLLRHVYLSEASIRLDVESLIGKDILCKFTIPQLFNKFGYYEGGKARLPKPLDHAINYEIKNLRYHGFRKKMTRNPLAKNWPRYYMALLTESSVGGKKVPVFQTIFDFLPHYKAESTLA